MSKKIDQLLKEKGGIRLDIGGGHTPNKGFVNIDMLKLPTVDIVHDIEVTPWPLPDECVQIATASHVLEHINPHKGVFIDVMNEVWRVMKPYGQFAIVVPHAQSPGYAQDPTHCNMINETTFHYFDPDPERKGLHGQLYGFYQPKPWKIVHQYFSYNGNIEILMEKRPDDETYHGILKPDDITKERIYEVK